MKKLEFCQECHEQVIAGVGNEQTEEINPVTPIRNVKLPSLAEIEEHNLTHLPYRNWCRHCVRGRGKESAHKAGTGDGGDVPELHLDYCFPGEEEAGKNLTVLVGRIRNTRMTMSSMIPSKTTGDFT